MIWDAQKLKNKSNRLSNNTQNRVSLKSFFKRPGKLKSEQVGVKSSLILWLKRITFVALFFIFASTSMVIIYRFVPVFLTPLMIQRSLESLMTNKWIGIEKTWVPLEKISPGVQKAVIKAEDFKFFDHYGFDFDAIQKAMEYNRVHKKMKGASTISQQTAKNVFLWPSRSWIRKGFEAYFTVLIETFWSKERILEVYLNVIELGHGVYGVEAAAQKYFHTSAAHLSTAQASRLAAVLPNPIRFRVDRPSQYVLRRQNLIMRRVAPPLPQEEQSLLDSLDIDLKFFDPDEDQPTKTKKK